MNAGQCSAVQWESLEPRAYAAETAETVSTTYADPHPSTVVIRFTARETPQLQRVAMSVGEDHVLRIVGTAGDDSFRIRKLHGGIEVRTNTRETYVYTRSHQTKTATAIIESTNVYAAGEVANMTIDGGDGQDTVKAGGLAFAPPVTSVESQTLLDARTPAPAGETPSDPITGRKWRKGSSWATLAAEQKEEADASRAVVAVFGDSHAARFPTIGAVAWRQQFPHGLNLGIAGDGTRQMLARIAGGLFDTFKPETLIVFAGTNNFNHPVTDGTDTQIFDGMMSVVRSLRAKLPDTQIILVGLLPRTNLGQAARIDHLNAALLAAATDNDFKFLDIYPRFIHDRQAAVNAAIGTDSHYTARGYLILGHQLDELIDA